MPTVKIKAALQILETSQKFMFYSFNIHKLIKHKYLDANSYILVLPAYNCDRIWFVPICDFFLDLSLLPLLNYMEA